MNKTMRSQPWANGYNVTHNTTSLRESKPEHMQRDKLGVTLPPISQVDCVTPPPISQVDCLGLHRVKIDVLTKEHDEKMANLRNRHKRLATTGPVKEFGRRKKKNPDFLDGKAPPISQIVMGSQHEVPWWTSRRPTRNVNSTRLLPISQVSCLSVSLESEQPEAKKQRREHRSKFGANDSDSEYVKLAKGGGQNNLLHYMEATPPLKRTLGNNGSLPVLKSKSMEDPTWKPSQWAALTSIKKADNPVEFTERK